MVTARAVAAASASAAMTAIANQKINIREPTINHSNGDGD